MDRSSKTVIDLVEAAYDLEKSDGDWLGQLVEVGAPVFDHGFGFCANEFVVEPCARGAKVALGELRMKSLPADFPGRVAAVMDQVSPELTAAANGHGLASTFSEAGRDFPEEVERVVGTLGYGDLLGMLAVDPNGAGVQIVAPLGIATNLTPRARERWQMLGAHIASAFRLRRALAAGSEQSGVDPTCLPRDAEAVLDASGFRIVEAVGAANENKSIDSLREAARGVDRARGALRRADPERALETWQALVRGRWSMVDWFDVDGRRFVLALPNTPEVPDPRGLTEQEAQVVDLILLGEPSKMIAYRIGLSQPRISGLLKSAMSKLGVTSKTQLVEKLGPMAAHSAAQDEEPLA